MIANRSLYVIVVLIIYTITNMTITYKLLLPCWYLATCITFCFRELRMKYIEFYVIQYIYYMKQVHACMQ